MGKTPNTMLRCILVSISLAATAITRASPLECNGNLVSVGATEQQVLAMCGEPTSRKENRWIYQREGDLPEILIFADGVVTEIKVGDDPGFGNTSPLGEHI